MRQFINSKNKRPVNCVGGVIDLRNSNYWLTYEDACTRRFIPSVVLARGVWCLDIDHAFNADMTMTDTAQHIINICKEEWVYIEVSTSGRGLHIFGRVNSELTRDIKHDVTPVLPGGDYVSLYVRPRHIVLGTPLPSSPLYHITDLIDAPHCDRLLIKLIDDLKCL